MKGMCDLLIIQVYFQGSANVGKSAFINALLSKLLLFNSMWDYVQHNGIKEKEYIRFLFPEIFCVLYFIILA